MHDATRLERIRRELFYGPRDYTKSFPDFSIPQRFSMVNPRDGARFFERLGASMTGDPELMVYVHLPFCFEECVFCNAFPHRVDRDAQASYVEHLLQEMALYLDAGVFDGKQVRCVYFGGGTPTAFSRAAIGRILDVVHGRMTLADGANVTSEAHPAALADAGRAKELAGLGIGRISLGCQTFDEHVLRLCNRDNPVELLRRAVAAVHDAGLSVNIDMMLGLPGQTPASVERDLDVLGTLRPDAVEFMRHEIVNPLAIELYKQQPQLVVSDDDLFAMILATQAWLDEQGYEQNGHFTSERFFPYRFHWLHETPFVSFGARARSYSKAVCYDNHEDLRLYAQLTDRGLPPVARTMWLSDREQMYRALFLRLQLRDGLARAPFAERFGVDPTEAFAPQLAHLGELGCVQVDDDTIQLTALGRTFVEDVSCYLIDRAVEEVADGARRAPHSSSTASAKVERL